MSGQRDVYVQNVRQAEGRIRLARARMAAKYPFHLALLGRMRVQDRPPGSGVDTMAVAVEGEEVVLFHNPEWVLSITVPQLVGVLLHEVHHVVFGHLTMSAEDHPNQAALTVAQEVTANEFIHEPLPGNPVLLADYPALPPRESTAERYRRLEKIIPPDRAVVTIDCHGLWAGQDAGRAGEAVRRALEDAVALAGPGQVPGELRDQLQGHGIGNTQGLGTEVVARGRGRADWRQLLRRYVGQVLEVRPVYTRPPRRFPDLVGILPGQGRQAARPKVMAAIDTSGSITARMLSQVDGELGRMARSYQVLVVECDCAVRRVYPYRPLEAVLGRGGTDLRPPLRRQFLREHRPDLVLFFTDGFGPAPERSPGIPVVWCLLPGGVRPAPWGRHIRIGPG
jgi:predicted metal-dependent peptidase